MAALRRDLNWEEAMSLCEQSVTNAVRDLKYGFINDRYKLHFRLNYTVTFCWMPKPIVKCDALKLTAKQTKFNWQSMWGEQWLQKEKMTLEIHHFKMQIGNNMKSVDKRNNTGKIIGAKWKRASVFWNSKLKKHIIENYHVNCVSTFI